MTNQIDARAVLIGDVDLGDGNIVEAGAVIVGPVRIGDGNYFGPHCVVGVPGQHAGLSEEIRRDGVRSGSEGGLTLGHGNVIREHTTIQRGVTGRTVIGNRCHLMSYSQVQHDCHLGDDIRIASNVQMGGYCWIGNGSYLGMSAVLHQFTVIGAYTMVGMGSVVTRRAVVPGSLLYGNPARSIRPNLVGLSALGIADLDWWESLVAGDPDVDLPEAVRAHVREYEAASVGRQALRVADAEFVARRTGGAED